MGPNVTNLSGNGAQKKVSGPWFPERMPSDFTPYFFRILVSEDIFDVPKSTAGIFKIVIVCCINLTTFIVMIFQRSGFKTLTVDSWEDDWEMLQAAVFA